jgi:pyruvate dehydrogenase complex dehydrogenase (E1) component
MKSNVLIKMFVYITVMTSILASNDEFDDPDPNSINSREYKLKNKEIAKKCKLNIMASYGLIGDAETLGE